MLNKEALKAAYRDEADESAYAKKYTSLTCDDVQDFLEFVTKKSNGLSDNFYPIYTNFSENELLISKLKYWGIDDAEELVYWGEDEITDILMNYPQIIDFSGHSHAPVNDPRSIYQQHFTCVGTGSFKYFELDEFDKVYGTVPPNEQNAAQFIIVEADAAGKVVIKPYDVITERFFGYEWTVETPWDPDSFTYTDERYLTDVRPYFALDAKLELTVDGNSVNVKFDQAKIEEDRVNDYKVTVRRKSDNAIVKQVCFWSRYYLNDMPETIEQKITELEAGEYIAEITAQGFWKNKSINKLCGEFTIK